MRKIILYIAMSLDGYIADIHGNVDWISGNEEQTDGDLGYQALMERVDTIIMGKTTYHQITQTLSPDTWPYPNQTTYIITHHYETDTKWTKFTTSPVQDLIKELQQKDGKDIWICGGASVIQPLIKDCLIDEYQICIVPTILGNGISLFSHFAQKLYLKDTQIDNGMVLLTYVPK